MLSIINRIRNPFLAVFILAVAASWNISAVPAATPNVSAICPAVPAGDHEQYHLPAITHPAAGLSSEINWLQIPATGGWYGAQVMDSCRIHADGFTTWHGKAAARIEVQPNDDPLDLGVGSERAEMAFLQDSTGKQITETSASGTVYYATSYYFPATWDGTFIRGNSNSWSFVWQFYGWQGLAAGRGYAADPAAQKYWFGGINESFSDGGNIAKGLWTDFVFMVDWSTGHLNVWRRNEGETAFNPVLDAGGPSVTGSIYVKQGLYRGGDVNGRTDVLWVGPTARGSAFAAVEMAAFGTNVGPAQVKNTFKAVPGIEGINLTVYPAQGAGAFHISTKYSGRLPLHIGIFSAEGRLVKMLSINGHLGWN
ncbi:MAG TPA: hypothetical protein VKF42_00350 [Chitinivibrionales bacterium]|jgi:hypothetical protein|nr:hypothetical protein [Chitinivibrionales bacterium]